MAIIAVISSHVARGFVGSQAAVVALQALGHEVWCVPTVSMAHHPGHGQVHGVPIAAHDLAMLLDDLGAGRAAGHIDGVLSGYLASTEQANVIAGFVGNVRAANAAALYCCDPVIGDNGALYVAEDIAAAQRDVLVPVADIITPNFFELGWLTDRPLRTNEEAVRAVEALDAACAIVTSAQALMRDAIATLLVAGKAAVLAETRLMRDPPHGTGDLYAALFLGHVLNGAEKENALERASAGVLRALTATHKAGRDSLDLIAVRNELARPQARVSMRTLVRPKNTGLPQPGQPQPGQPQPGQPQPGQPQPGQPQPGNGEAGDG